MDSDRPSHRTGDLFICFTARNHHHSSSMRSILSPNRSGPRDPPISLTTSLSRRLRTNRSIKGAASPAMFPTTGKKRTGNGFDNPEPSSPKVTCIGQVRVKSKKKQGKNQLRLRSLSRRHSTGDVSFRKLDHSHDGFSKSSKLAENCQMGRSISTNLGSNQDIMFKEQRNNYSQKWVHLPLTICEALRALGSEFSCLFPCRSSCFSPAPERKPVEETGEVGSCSVSGSSCSKVFTRWLVAFQDGDDGDNRRDSQLVVNDENEEEDCYEDSEFMVSRRHVFNDLEIVNNRIEGCIDEARVSICIPPKNALLLMRCRSDPLKMEALANRLWESTIGQNDDEQDDDDDECFDGYENNDEMLQKRFDFDKSRDNVEVFQEKKLNQEEHQDQEIEENNDDYEEDFVTFFGSLFEENVGEDNDEMLDGEGLFETGDENEIQESETGESNMEKVKGFGGKNDEEMETQYGERSEMAEEMVDKSKDRESEELEREGLPECLLLMMCEPKLSMEVCKETWVSSKDFFRRPSSRKKPPPPPPPPTLLTANEDGQDKSKLSDTSSTNTLDCAKCDKHFAAGMTAAPPLQPGRSSCSLPVAPSMAEMLEQKLVNAVGYEPFVLTRCKSEAMRTAAAKLAPDSYFWKNRKLEPLRRASFGVGAAGLGF